ncbi:HpcH/HpaI aldolase family protein [Serratia ficaria]|uniref:HpcH/HpaI aldolase family protein n=1 Tax=Serratia ficaria TaxID=61651 RepID=UPI00077C5317|nr:aldolase/citrate lyase family protein [Serratia ficaria]CAI0802641.1 5-keto-4-deoxy-D-glucarate aldolase [Serratia ficaria]CAI1666725.1 5-keto-4-deoxy-D-glucarate aldolase [Serratia ficaria]CAI1667160.1 5-keto-4-deoxy-D-glucarate aldolase [Serratia ficaria]CAI2433482.1 5-keto-4-deoxy-D-glucarate aldolase [Serratia ficaria]CAI2459008.1 5-keto-4-deoxy-D-glucarate aldolase [Serratia ficaria]
MRLNNIKQRWHEGETVLNGWLSIANAFSAEIMAEQGYDALTIDLQHGLIGYEAAAAMLQAMRASGVAPMVRVPWLEPGIIMKALDAGAWGVICPMVNTAEQARALVSCVRYPPSGSRSFGPTRAVVSAGPDYGQHADEQVVCFAMIETAEALNNIDAIVATPGLDGIYIGPADLTLGLTGRKYRTGFDRDEPDVVAAIRQILAAAHRAGKKAGLHNGTAAYAAQAAEWGFDLVTVSNDVQLLRSAALTSVQQFRALNGGEKPAETRPRSGGY